MHSTEYSASLVCSHWMVKEKKKKEKKKKIYSLFAPIDSDTVQIQLLSFVSNFVPLVMLICDSVGSVLYCKPPTNVLTQSCMFIFKWDMRWPRTEQNPEWFASKLCPQDSGFSCCCILITMSQYCPLITRTCLQHSIQFKLLLVLEATFVLCEQWHVYKQRTCLTFSFRVIMPS